MRAKRVYYYEDNNLKVMASTARYRFSLPYIKNMVVLDIGCGARCGPWILSGVVSKVVGIDVSGEAISYCLKNWSKDNISYLMADAVDLPFPDQSFDAVVSFEVIEHLDDCQQYLAEVSRVLKPAGVFILSTPNRPVTSPDGVFTNPDHIREYDSKEFTNILASQFTGITLYGQMPSDKVIRAENLLKQAYQDSDKVPTLIKCFLSKGLRKLMFDKYLSFSARIKTLPTPNQISEDDFFFERDRTEKARYLLAVCMK